MYFFIGEGISVKYLKRLRKKKNVTSGFGQVIKMTLHLHPAKGWLLGKPEPDGCFPSV